MGTKKNWLEPSDLALVTRHVAMTSIDLILRDPQGAVLVGYRTSEPAKDCWFVPGGRVSKLETLDDAFERILLDETGLKYSRRDADFRGVYEHFYDANRFGDPSFGTHYVVLAYEIHLQNRPSIKIDDQHSAIKWLGIEELIADPSVHPNTKAYFL